MSEEHDELLGRFAKLNRFDPITITWVDASQSQNVSLKAPVPNHVVETKVTTDGRFLCVQKGEVLGGEYLLLIKDLTEDMRATLQSIPISLVRQINPFSKVQLMSRSKDRLKAVRIKYPDGIVKTVKIRDRRLE